MVKKITQKLKTPQKVKSPESTVHVYSHESKSFFETSKKLFEVATLTLNQSFKAVPIYHNSTISTTYLNDVTAIHIYTFSFTLNTMYSHSFTRPPPFLKYKLNICG